MDRYRCMICGHIYDPAIGEPDTGIPPGIAFEKLSDSWICPVCGSTKDKFVRLGD